MKLTNELIFRNLLLLQQVEKEGLPRDKFVDVSGTNLKDSEELLTYLLENDLIETENDENVFFLTDVGYKAVELGWHDKDLEENTKPRASRALKYSGSESGEKKPKEPYLTSLRGQAIVLSVLIGIGSFLYALDYTEVVNFFGSDDSEKPEQVIDIHKEEEEQKVTCLKDFDKMTYYRNFNWFGLGGDTLKDSVRSRATIGVEKGERDSFNILVYGHHALSDSFHFVKNNGVYSSEFTSYGEKYGNAFDYKREILLDQKKNRIIVLLYSRLRPEEPGFWPINAIIELYPERYDEYWFHLYENPPIDKDKLLSHARIRDYIKKEKLKTSRRKEYGFILKDDEVEFASVSTFENDTVNHVWNELESSMIATRDLKFSNDPGMRIWHYFLHLIDHKDLAEIGY